MTRYNLALLSLLASTVSAVPHYGQLVHRHSVHPKSGSQPSGIFPPGPDSTVGPTAPYGLGNTTTIAPTGTAPVTSSPVLTSVVTVLPEPGSTSNGESPVESSASASSEFGNSPIGGTSAAGGECGPATVTVTNANTITVTVPASSAPAETTPIIESPIIPTTSAPYGNGTNPAPIGTGTGVEPLPTSTLAVLDTSSEVIESPTVIHPIPLATSASAVSPETATTSTPAEGTESSETPSTEQPVETPEEPVKSPEEVVRLPEEVKSPEAPVVSTDKTVESTEEADESTEEVSPNQASTTPTSSSDNVVARGLVYNEASLTSSFANAGWLYNWDQTPGGAVDTTKEFVPMLWDTLTDFHAPRWVENAEAAITAGSTHLLAFNEPDLPAQANMDVPQSVAGWMEYMEPFHAKHNGAVKLGSPAVCNGPEAHLGLSYLKDFLAACGGCHVDFLAIHWYGLASDDGVRHLQEHIAKAQEMAGGRPIWLTEFQPSGNDEEQAAFLGKILPWLDDKSNGVERYAYFKVETMVSGDSLTQTGAAYAA
ncbi:MAG: hypothetical protein Q9210_006946 [Variospora velana]